jgi:hypothetical protein
VHAAIVQRYSRFKKRIHNNNKEKIDMQNTQTLQFIGAGKWLLAAAWLALNLMALKFAVLAWSTVAGAIVLVLLLWMEFFARERFIRHVSLPVFLKTKLRASHTYFTAKETDLIEHGLKQFFLANLRSKGKFVAMPSKIADEMWHEFILHTKAYEAWCKQAYGKLLHHTPAIALTQNTERNDGLRRAWYWACKDENIDPRAPSRLPLLFALDAKLGIAGGFHYVPDCSDIAKKSDDGGSGGVTYCGTSFGDGSSSGDSDGFGGSDSGGDGGGDGGGCGGGGD